MTRIFFATDIHGSEICYKKFLAAANFYRADVLILGGDITGKILVPIVEHPDGTYRARFAGRDHILKRYGDIQKLEEKILFVGYYPYITTLSELEKLQSDKSKFSLLFNHLILERIKRWMQLAEERFKGTNKKIYITGGNDDIFEIEDVLNNSDVIINPEGKVVEINDHYEMISSGYCNVTPWKCPRDIEEEELGEKIEAMVANVRDIHKCIFNFHAPPYDSTLDEAIEVKVHGNEIAYVTNGIKPKVIPVGSKSVRRAIEKFQPIMGLHGHIHESRGVVKIGKTVCINPGSEYSEGILRGAIINLNHHGIVNYLLTSG